MALESQVVVHTAWDDWNRQWNRLLMNEQVFKNQVGAGSAILWPPCFSKGRPLTIDEDNNRYRMCCTCDKWFSTNPRWCSGCKRVCYCSHECQAKSWHVHKYSCPLHRTMFRTLSCNLAKAAAELEETLLEAKRLGGLRGLLRDDLAAGASTSQASSSGDAPRSQGSVTAPVDPGHSRGTPVQRWRTLTANLLRAEQVLRTFRCYVELEELRSAKEVRPSAET